MIEAASDAVAAGLSRHPFPVRHRVAATHPLLVREVLAARAEAWPRTLLEHHRADLPVVLPSGKTDQLPVGPGDVVRGIDGNACWIVLLGLQNSPPYQALLEECLHDIEPIAARVEGRVTGYGVNVLVGSPGSVVPVHFDFHHNFLLQIEGSKRVTIGTFSDCELEQREVDRYFDEGSNNVRVLPDAQTEFELLPGDGVYIPPYAMHWVRAGDDTSLGLSCGFRTETSDRTRAAHQFNSKLRRRGLRPRAVGRSATRDRAKALAFMQAKRVRNKVRSTATRRSA